MGYIETGSHTFVVRIWIEKGARATWRGHVTHVATGTDRYFQEPGEMVEFIQSFVRDLTTDPAASGGPAEPA